MTIVAEKPTGSRRRRLQEDRPIGRMRRQWGGRMVAGCGHRCLACRRFLGHRQYAGGCPGVRPSKRNATPLCHVDLLTGRMEYPLDADRRLIEGQERFWRLRTA